MASSEGMWQEGKDIRLEIQRPNYQRCVLID